MPNIDDLQARLRTAVSDADTKIAFLFGAGMSAGIVPNVEQMVDHFVGELPKPEQSNVRQQLGGIANPSERYQRAAELVLARGGKKRIRSALCKATLSASTEETDTISTKIANMPSGEIRALEHDLEWRVGRSHTQFATFYASIPPRIRGPILTTNFDPLIEVALREKSILANTVTVSGTTIPTAEQLEDLTSTPVFHLHGYWRNSNSLHTQSQLNATRPQVASFIRSHLSNCLLVVAGYSGWNDIFMRELNIAFTDGQLYDSEICWSVFSSNEFSIQENSELAKLVGSPGFNIYFGIDASRLFQVELNSINVDTEIGGASLAIAPSGFSIVNPTQNIFDHNLDVTSSSEFADGRQPKWIDALPNSWPRLDATSELETSLIEVLEAGGGGGAVAIGPIGEGKSLGLMQTAIRLADKFPSWTFLWREHGAPNITSDWIREAKARYGAICLCIDDADLVSADISSSLEAWANPESQVAFAMASHDRLWWKTPASIHKPLKSVLFHGITTTDARNISEEWARKGLLPSAYSSHTDEEAIRIMSSKLRTASMGIEGMEESTLMGAVLSTRLAAGLKERVRELIDRFSREKLSNDEDISMADIFGCICLIQLTYDPEGMQCTGASKPLLAAIVDLNGTFPDTRILTLLGREALVSFAGERVYSRHSSIAKTVIDIMRSRGRLPRVCHLTGRAAARLKVSSVVERSLWNEPYNLSKKLGHQNEAIAAAEGVLHGAPHSFSARLDRIRVLRKFDSNKALYDAKSTLLHRTQFSDYHESIRIFLNELARCAIECNEPELSLGAAAIGIGGIFEFPLDRSQCSYFYKSFIDAGLQLREQNYERSGKIPEIAASLAVDLCSVEDQHRISSRLRLLDLASSKMTYSISQRTNMLQEELNAFATHSSGQLNLSEHFHNSLNLSWIA